MGVAAFKAVEAAVASEGEDAWVDKDDDEADSIDDIGEEASDDKDGEGEDSEEEDVEPNELSSERILVEKSSARGGR